MEHASFGRNMLRRKRAPADGKHAPHSQGVSQVPQMKKLFLSLAVILAATNGFAVFKIVVLPDTQIYSESYPEIFYSQTDWIVDNVVAEDIAFVTHLGDVGRCG